MTEKNSEPHCPGSDSAFTTQPWLLQLIHLQSGERNNTTQKTAVDGVGTSKAHTRVPGAKHSRRLIHRVLSVKLNAQPHKKSGQQLKTTMRQICFPIKVSKSKNC